MIVCSCNVLSDTNVRTVAKTATRRTTSYVYSCLGCRARCGRCARTIREIMDEVFDGAKVGRADGGAVLAAPADKQLVCTENLSSGVVVVKSAKDGV